MTARSAAEAAVPMNRRIFTRSTGTPTLRAAIADPPEPKIQLPKLVRWRMKVATSARPSHQRIEMSNGPMSAVKIAASGSPSVAASRPPTCVRPVIVRVTPIVAPRRMNSVPSVTMNDGSRVRTTM